MAERDAFRDDVDTRNALHLGEEPLPRIEDVERAPISGEPPVLGAQWDEVHQRWEVWDEASGEWQIAGDEAGDGVAPADENPMPAPLAHELVRAEDLEAAHEVVPDVDRSSPVGPAPRGAQWNEVVGRWERWDEGAGDWVEATAE